MKIDICSDLHIDHWWHTTKIVSPDGPKNKRADGTALYVDWKWYKDNAGDASVLVIAGDLSNSLEIAVSSLRDASENYDLVVYVDGNHEHYNRRPYSANMNGLATACAGLRNVAFLCRNEPVFMYNDVAFVGSNGWYDWRCYLDRGISLENAYAAWRLQINDLPNISFDEGDPSVLARRDAVAMAIAVTDLQNDLAVSNIVAVTHTCPRVDSDGWRDHLAWDTLTPSFVNSQMEQVLGDDKSKKIKHWIFGHTHTRSDKVVNGTRFINNCRGYPRELGPWSLVQIEV